MSDQTNLNAWSPGELVRTDEMDDVNTNIMGNLFASMKPNTVMGIVPTIISDALFTHTAGFAFFGTVTDPDYVDNTGTTTAGAIVLAPESNLSLTNVNCAIYVEPVYVPSNIGVNGRVSVSGNVYSSTDPDAVGIKICDVIDGVPTNFNNNDARDYIQILDNELTFQNPDGSALDVTNIPGPAEAGDLYQADPSFNKYLSPGIVDALNAYTMTSTSQWTNGQERIIATIPINIFNDTSNGSGAYFSMNYFSAATEEFSLNYIFTLTSLYVYLYPINNYGFALGSPPPSFTYKYYTDNVAGINIITATPNASIAYSGNYKLTFNIAGGTGMASTGTPYLGTTLSSYPNLGSLTTKTLFSRPLLPLNKVWVVGDSLGRDWAIQSIAYDGQYPSSNGYLQASCDSFTINNGSSRAYLNLSTIIGSVNAHDISATVSIANCSLYSNLSNLSIYTNVGIPNQLVIDTTYNGSNTATIATFNYIFSS